MPEDKHNSGDGIIYVISNRNFKSLPMINKSNKNITIYNPHSGNSTTRRLIKHAGSIEREANHANI